MEENGVKIGARVLDDETLKILIPEFESIFIEIDKIRKNISLKEDRSNSLNYEIIKQDQEFSKHHNNVFSILGERGTGKTSVELTIKYKIMNQKKEQDIVLPMIVPQDMDGDSSIIGWIIAHFTNIIKKIEEKYMEKNYIFSYNETQEIGDKILLDKFSDLKKAFFLRQKNYKKSLGYEETTYEYLEKNEQIIRENINLSIKFKEFIDEFILFKKNFNSRKIEEIDEPLIFIFFDDVDISNQKCLKILETILRYLSHENIVVFIAGDYSTFKETITLNYLKEDQLLSKELIESKFELKTALEIRQTLAYDYLKKVLSPALRYELNKLSFKNKKKFKGKSTGKELCQLLEENRIDFIDPFYEILDSKPRGLINIYYFLKDTGQELEDERLGRLTKIIIDSSSILNIKKDEIEKIIDLKGSMELSFEQFKKEDYSETNLKILLLILFVIKNKSWDFEEYESEVLEYLKNYLDDKIQIIGEGRKVEIFNILLEGQGIEKSICLFYKILNKFKDKKITINKFYQEYFYEILELTKEDVVSYYESNFYSNKEKIKKIFKRLLQLNDLNNLKLLGEMELRFKNLYLIDEVREIIKKYVSIKNKTFSSWSKTFTSLKLSSDECSEFFLYTAEVLQTDLLKDNNLTLKAKLDNLFKKIELAILIVVEIQNYIKNNKDFLYDIDREFLITERDLFSVNAGISNNEIKRNKIEELKNRLKNVVHTEMGENVLRKIVAIVRNGKLDISEYYNRTLEIRKKIENDTDREYMKNYFLVEQYIKLLDDFLNINNGVLIVFEEIKGIDFFKSIVKQMSILKSLDIAKKREENIFLSKTEKLLSVYFDIYKNIKNFQLYEKISDKTEMELLTSDRILDIEDLFIENKIIHEIKNLKVIENLRLEEKYLVLEGYLNSDNYVNVKKLYDRYRAFGRKLSLKGTSSNNSETIILEYLSTEIKNKISTPSKEALLDLEILIENFIIIYNEKQKIVSIDKEENRLKNITEQLKKSQKLKRFFK